MTRILKLGRQRITLTHSQKIRTDIYHHLTRDEACLIVGIAPLQAGIVLRFPHGFAHAILKMKWSYPGMVASDFCDSCRWKLKAWRNLE